MCFRHVLYDLERPILRRGFICSLLVYSTDYYFLFIWKYIFSGQEVQCEGCMLLWNTIKTHKWRSILSKIIKIFKYIIWSKGKFIWNVKSHLSFQNIKVIWGITYLDFNIHISDRERSNACKNDFSSTCCMDSGLDSLCRPTLLGYIFESRRSFSPCWYDSNALLQN